MKITKVIQVQTGEINTNNNQFRRFHQHNLDIRRKSN